MAVLTKKETSNSVKYEKDHFKLNRWILRGAGLWAPETKSKTVSILFKCYSIFILLYVDVYFALTEFVSIKDTYKNLSTLIKNVGFACTHLLGTIKVFFWYAKHRQLREIITTLESEEFHYESCGEFQPAQIFNEAKRSGIKYTATYFMMGHITASLSYLPLIISTFTNPTYINNEEGDLRFHQEVPYYSWIPWKYDTPKSYLLALAYQMGPVYHYGYTVVGMDTLFMNILNLIAAHLSVLKGAFKSIRARCLQKTEENNSINEDQLNQMMLGEFKRSINHLQTLFTVCEKVENVFKYLTLVQVLFTLFIFCTCLFQVSTTPITSKGFASEMVYMIAMGTELILYSWFGNEVTMKASEIIEALWESDWLETSCSYRSNILITMIRMTRPLQLTVGKFAPLTLNTFVAILKSSYTYFAVLKHVNNN